MRLLARCLGSSPSRVPAREQAAAEERAFQRTIAVHAAATEAGGFASGVKSLDDLAVRPEYPRVQIGLEATQRLARQDVELDRDQRAVVGIEDAMRLCGADQFVADVTPRIVDVHHLRVLDVGVRHLAVARLDLRL